jgi:hypothetical protein
MCGLFCDSSAALAVTATSEEHTTRPSPIAAGTCNTNSPWLVPSSAMSGELGSQSNVLLGRSVNSFSNPVVGDGEGLTSSRIQNTEISVNANLNMDTEINPTLSNRSPQHSHNDTNISNEDSWAEMIGNIRKRNKVPKLPRGGKSTKTSLTLGSLNINGRDSNRSMSSPGHKFSYLKQTMDENRIGILAIQESHLDVDSSVQFNHIFQRWFKLVNSGHPTKPNSTIELFKAA